MNAISLAIIVIMVMSTLTVGYLVKIAIEVSKMEQQESLKVNRKE